METRKLELGRLTLFSALMTRYLSIPSLYFVFTKVLLLQGRTCQEQVEMYPQRWYDTCEWPGLLICEMHRVCHVLPSLGMILSTDSAVSSEFEW